MATNITKISINGQLYELGIKPPELTITTDGVLTYDNKKYKLIDYLGGIEETYADNISSVEEIENPEYKVVYLDSDDKILYGVNVDNVITDNLSVVSKDISKAITYMENNNQPQKNLINS